MGGPVDALTGLCRGKIGHRTCRHAWLGCLSECCHGDDELVGGSGKHSIEILHGQTGYIRIRTKYRRIASKISGLFNIMSQAIASILNVQL